MDLLGCLSYIYSKLTESSSPICNNFLANLLMAIPLSSIPSAPKISKILPFTFTYNLSFDPAFDLSSDNLLKLTNKAFLVAISSEGRRQAFNEKILLVTYLYKIK